jgi:WD40 repeat protein
VTALCPFQSKILVSGGGNLDSTLIVWSLSQRKALHVMKGHQSGITSIIDLLDGHAVASGSYDNHAIIWDVHEGQAVCALRKHTAMISSLQLTQRRDHMLTGSWDRTIGVWEFSFETGARNIKGAKYIREIKCDSAVLCMHSIGER